MQFRYRKNNYMIRFLCISLFFDILFQMQILWVETFTIAQNVSFYLYFQMWKIQKKPKHNKKKSISPKLSLTTFLHSHEKVISTLLQTRMKCERLMNSIVDNYYTFVLWRSDVFCIVWRLQRATCWHLLINDSKSNNVAINVDWDDNHV